MGSGLEYFHFGIGHTRRMPPRVMPPGKLFSYNDHGMSLAGLIVEEVSGVPFAEYVAKNIFRPLGMDHLFPQGAKPAPAAATIAADNMEAFTGCYNQIAGFSTNALRLQVRMHPNQRFQQTGKRLMQVIDRLADFLSNWRREIAHPHPERALRLALMMVISLIRDFVVFSETTMYLDFLGQSPDNLPILLTESFQRMVNGRSESIQRAP